MTFKNYNATVCKILAIQINNFLTEFYLGYEYKIFLATKNTPILTFVFFQKCKILTIVDLEEGRGSGLFLHIFYCYITCTFYIFGTKLIYIFTTFTFQLPLPPSPYCDGILESEDIDLQVI